MIQSIYSGVSSLQSFQTGIDVLANNVANVNTTGFKGSRTEFSNLFNTAVSQTSTSGQVGQGVRVSATSLTTQTGSYEATQNPTDLAIVGNDGWFGLSGPNDSSFFTRAGNFHFDPYNPDGALESPFYPYDDTRTQNTELRLVSQEGLFVTGTLANNTNNSVLEPVVDSLDLGDVEEQSALVFPADLTFPVVATSTAEFFGNIGVENLPQVASSTVISPQSERNNLRLSFTQTTPQPATGISWDVVATTQSLDGTSIYDTKTGVVTFDENGTLINSTLDTIDNDGATVSINLAEGPGGFISRGGSTVATSATTDGALAGDLLGYTVNRNGEIISTFTNGKQSVVGKVAIYHFQNDQGLEAVSGTKFKASSNSGEPIFYDESNGQILSSTLETSNVSLEVALTELIIMQRSYDAASKTITTSDQMLQNALQM